MQVCAKIAAVLAVLAIGGVSIWLAPNPAGRGTEPQLFGPCPVGVGGAIRCPTCGLTSGMAALVRGRPLEAARRNLMAPLLGAVCLLTFYLAAGSLLAKRPILELPGALWLWNRALWLPFVAAICWLIMQLLGW